jgi:hypothetical protein
MANQNKRATARSCYPIRNSIASRLSASAARAKFSNFGLPYFSKTHFFAAPS